MQRFSTEYGNIHFLFSNPDEYYTESLLKLNLRQYLNHCLRSSGFGRTLFVQPSFSSPGQYVIETGDEGLAEEFCDEKASFYRLFQKKKMPKETREIRISGRMAGKLYTVNFPEGEALVQKLHGIFCSGQANCAVVVPLPLFCELYDIEELRKELCGIIRLKRRDFIVVLTSGMNAEESFELFEKCPQIFCSELFPELKKIFDSQENLRLYEEMKNELGERYHVFNQMGRNEIRRLLKHLLWIEGKAAKGMRWQRLEEYTELLFTWYHAPDFMDGQDTGLPPKGSRSLSELGDALRQENGRLWSLLDGWLEGLLREDRSGLPEEYLDGTESCAALKKALMKYGTVQETYHPMFSETGEIRRMRSGIRRLAGQNEAVFAGRLRQTEELLRSPWNHPKPAGSTGLLKSLKILEELKGKQLQSETAAGYILEYLDFTVLNSGMEDTRGIYPMMCDCYEQRITCSCMCVELEKIKEERILRRDRYRREFEDVKKHLASLRRNPLYEEIFQQMKNGAADASFVATHAPELSQAKAELVRLNKAIKNETLFIHKNQEELGFYTAGISNLELTLTELGFEKNPDTLGNVLKRAQQLLETQSSREEQTAGEMRMTGDQMQSTIERLKKTVDSLADPEEDRIFSELMGPAGKTPYEI